MRVVARRPRAGVAGAGVDVGARARREPHARSMGVGGVIIS